MKVGLGYSRHLVESGVAYLEQASATSGRSVLIDRGYPLP